MLEFVDEKSIVSRQDEKDMFLAELRDNVGKWAKIPKNIENDWYPVGTVAKWGGNQRYMMATKTQFEVDRSYRHNQLMFVLGVIAIWAILVWVTIP